MKNRLILPLVILILTTGNYFSQTWMEQLQNGENFYKIQKTFNDYMKDKDMRQKGVGIKQFKRWEYITEPRVYPSGDISLLSTTWANYQEFLNQNVQKAQDAMINNTNQTASTTWAAMGPFGALSGNATNGYPRKAGRINFITFHPSNANTFWIGAPGGGLWKTTNNGTSWTTTTDNLAVIGCSDLAINPSNPNIMYLATGDGYNYNSRSSVSVGVLKSIDGGTTWNSTGLTFAVSQQIQLRRLIINPTNPNILLAATNQGVYTTTNAAVSWSVTAGVNTYDVKFNAANSNTVYATGVTFSMSTDGGLTFAQVTSGIPPGGALRANIAVTPANPNYVYVVKATNSNPSIMQGVYRSINGGSTFSLMTSTNYLSGDCFTPSVDGQGFYDLTLAASPLNANEITLGGVTAWQSLNGGNTWTNIGCGYNNTNPPFLHADHHEFEYTTAGALYAVGDGGINQYTGSAWTDISNPMNIAQMYKIGLSTLSPNLWMTGHQDNGSNIYSNGVYKASLAADGTDCFIDRTTDNYMYAEIYQGEFYYSNNGGLAWQTCTAGLSGLSNFCSPWKQDPQVATTFYCGKAQMKKSIVWPPVWFAPIGTMSGVNPAQYVTEFAIAPSNNQKIYAIHGTTGMYVSNDAGATWTVSNTGINTGAGALTFVTVSPTNSLVAWASMSGYSAPNKVFKTVNGGLNWTNISYNLPNIPANCSVYELNSAIDRVYVGMDVGVYYIDNSNPTTWFLYNTGLPNTPISDMEISPASPTKIRAATYGRGVYQVDIVPSPLPPVTAFNYGGSPCSITSTILCNDISTNSPNAWSWTVTPATGVTIITPTSQNPTITFANYGTYTISLLASNGFGAGTVYNKTITIATPTIIASTTSSALCTGQSVTLSASGANTYTWQPGGFNGANASYTPGISQNYTVTGTLANGCSSFDTVSVYVSLCTGMISNGNNNYPYSVFPNPTNDKLSVNIKVDKATDFDLKMTDETGKVVVKQSLKFTADKPEQQLNISSLSDGVYFLKIISKEGDTKSIKIIKE